jgi:TRAP-type C4-dicarboxylate transport system permease small subunit
MSATGRPEREHRSAQREGNSVTRSAMGRFWRGVDRPLSAIVDAGAWLVLPVALLLFLQWPLRELVGLWSREANDFGQWLFALYVAIALTAATRRGAHLATDALSHRYPERVRTALHDAVRVLALLPWTGFILWSGADIAARSQPVDERPTSAMRDALVGLAALGFVGTLLIGVASGYSTPSRSSSCSCPC